MCLTKIRQIICVKKGISFNSAILVFMANDAILKMSRSIFFYKDYTHCSCSGSGVSSG